MGYKGALANPDGVVETFPCCLTSRAGTKRGTNHPIWLQALSNVYGGLISALYSSSL